MDPKTKELETKARDYGIQAAALVVNNQVTYDAAAVILDGAKAIMKAMDESYDPVIAAAFVAHKAAVKAKKDQYAPVEEASKLINDKMKKWWREEQARVAEKQREADELAKKKAEDKAREAAEMLEAAGMSEAAEEAIAAPVIIEKVVVSAPTKISGARYQLLYSAEVVDLMALVKAVAAGTQPLAYLEANLPALNAAARSQKEQMRIDGVKVVAK